MLLAWQHKWGSKVEAFVTLTNALIEEQDLTAHFSFRECGRRVSDCLYLFRKFPQLKSQFPHHATIIELFKVLAGLPQGRHNFQLL
jgi:hypothetical protein